MSSRNKSNRDAPVNLTSDIMRKEDRQCSSTCNFSYQYNTSTCNVFHKGSYLRIPYDSGSGGIYPAKYNGVDYKVEHIMPTDGYVIPFSDTPLDTETTIKNVILSLIASAKK
jgi:hypothetical protein